MTVRDLSGFVVLYAATLVCVGALVIAGCNDATTPSQAANVQSQYLLDVEPTGAIAVTEAKAAISTNPEVVLVGRISAGEHEPWEAGRAAFLISDAAALIAAGDDDSAHAADCNCHFCNKDKSANDSLAVVKILDNDGDVLPIDARQLLGVEKNQIVVVQGKGEVDALGNLTIAATGVYVRR